MNQDLDANEGAIQNAYDELLRAFNELKQVVNKDNLLLQIELAKQVLANKDKYDIELVKELEELLSHAVALIANDVSSEDVNKMSEILENNKSKISEVAYRKCRNRIEELKLVKKRNRRLRNSQGLRYQTKQRKTLKQVMKQCSLNLQ